MLRFTRLKTWWSARDNASKATLIGVAIIFLAKTTLSSASIEEVLEHANTLYAEKNYASASEEFERATEMDKGSTSAWRGLGWSLWALGQKDRAYQIWQELLRAVPDDFETLVSLGKANEQDQNWKAALDYYTTIEKLVPGEISAHQGKARIFIAQKNLSAAEQEARAALRISPKDSNARSILADALIGLGRFQEAEVNLQSLSSQKPVPQNLNRLGWVLAELGQYEQAAQAYKTSLQTQASEDTLSAWRGLGVKARKSGQNQRAYAIWQSIIREHPTDLATLLALGRANHQDQQLQASLDYFQQALQIAPENQVAHLSRAKIFYMQGEYQEAEKEVAAVLQRQPSNNEASLILVDILLATGNSEEAEHILRPMVELDPNPKNLSRMGAVLAGLSKDEESTEAFQDSLRADPENLKAVQGLARVLWNQHRYQESTALLKSFLERHPDNDIVRARLAEHASANLDWDSAEREFRTLISKHPEDNRWKVKLARQLEMAGRQEEAVKLAEQVVAKEPNEVALNLLANNAIYAGNIATGIYWLNRIVDVSPTPDRLNQLGKLYIEQGNLFEKDNQHEAAQSQYASASTKFKEAAAVDPIKSRSPIGLVEALRLQKKYPEALQLAKELVDKYPNSVDVIQQLVNIYRDQADYPAAQKWLASKQAFFPDNIKLKQEQAKFTFYSGGKTEGLQMLHTLANQTQQKNIQVLLYHGITISERQDTMPVKRFREQMLALKRDGYQSINIAQLKGFLEGKNTLPANPILITFDDARSDSFQNADPILAETGFTATMFIPVSDIATHGSYTAVWPIVREMNQTGRWDMQCHGTEAQHYVPVNAQGHLGRFMANRKWLADAGRQESQEEFAARIEQDLRNCKETLLNEVPGAQVTAFAFPYSDQGHRSLSNSQDIYKLNRDLVKGQFQLAFHVDNEYPISMDTPKYALPRFEVPRTLSGQELVQQLKSINPYLSTQYELARMEMDAGHYSQSLAIFNQLDQQNAIDKGLLMATTGKILRLSGDHAGARERLTYASTLRPNDPMIQNEIAALDRRLRPTAQVNGLYFQDNARRSYFSVGPSGQYPITDKLTVGASYKYLEFNQKLGEAKQEQHFQTSGHQVSAQLNYELGARSMLAMSAGAADFSGSNNNSGSTFAIGGIKVNTAVNDKLEFIASGDHNYVNTAGAIAKGIGLSTAQAGVKYKITEALNLRVNHAYSYYTDHIHRNRTELELNSPVWNDPDVTVGALFIRDDTSKNNPLFWTPNNYISFSVPVNVKKTIGKNLVVELMVAPGTGRETGNDFKFQINTTGSLNWNIRDDIMLYLSAGHYQAATYTNFSTSAGVSMRF